MFDQVPGIFQLSAVLRSPANEEDIQQPGTKDTQPPGTKDTHQDAIQPPGTKDTHQDAVQCPVNLFLKVFEVSLMYSPVDKDGGPALQL